MIPTRFIQFFQKKPTNLPTNNLPINKSTSQPNNQHPTNKQTIQATIQIPTNLLTKKLIIQPINQRKKQLQNGKDLRKTKYIRVGTDKCKLQQRES